MLYNRLNRFNIAPTDVIKGLTGHEPDDFNTITRSHNYLAYHLAQLRLLK